MYSTQASPPPQDLTGVISDDDLRKSRVVGGGGFGDVYIIDHPTLGKIAVKRLRDGGRPPEEALDMRRRARREATIWQTLHHQHLLGFVGISETPDNLCLICPYMPNGTIKGYLQTHPNADRITLLAEVASALAYLHQEKVIHGDIKGANVLVGNDGHALLCDFSLSRPMSEVTSSGMRGSGSTRWMSPEFMERGGGKNFECDIWAFGMLIYEVLSGYLPYYELKTEGLVVRAVTTGKLPSEIPERGPDGADYSALWSIARRCWNADPNLRPSMREVHDDLLHLRVPPALPPRPSPSPKPELPPRSQPTPRSQPESSVEQPAALRYTKRGIASDMMAYLGMPLPFSVKRFKPIDRA